MFALNVNSHRFISKMLMSFLCICFTVSSASAVCTDSGDAAITGQHCGNDYISYLTDTGSLTLTIEDETSTSVELTTANDTVSDTNHSLILKGFTILNRPDYSAVIMESGAANRNASVQVEENVSITSGGGFGAIWLLNNGSGDLSVDNAGDVTANASYGISVLTHDGTVNINNTGSVTSTTYRGIYANTGFNTSADSPVGITITNSGTVDAYEAGIRAENYMGAISIENSGDVESTNRQGIVAWTDDGGGIDINNSGSVISGNDMAIQAVGTVGDVTVTNSGSLTASKNEGVASAATGYSGIFANIYTQGAVIVTNTADGVISAEDDYGIYAGTASGDVSVRNSGSVSALNGIEGESSDSAVSIENSGTVQAASTGINLLGSTANSFTNTGSVTTTGAVAVQTNDSDTTITNNGLISAGSESATAISMGDGDNRLVLGTGSEIVGKVVSGSGEDTLVLSGVGAGEINADDISESGKYQGFENVEKRDDSTWVVSGTSTDISWTIYSGTLSVSGVVKNIDVEQGGTLSGTGNIGSIVVNSGGTLAPGNSIGTTSADDVTFTTGSSFEVEVDSAGSSDKVLANGVVTIESGSAIQITPENGTDDGSTYDPYTTYTIISADGGIVGTFDSVVDDFAFLDVRLDYDANTLTMGLQKNDVVFQSVTDSANQRNIAGIITDLGSGNVLYDAVVTLSEAGARQAFEDLSGEVHASLKTMLIDDSKFFREAVADRSTNMGESSYHAWGSAFGSWGDWDGDGNASKLERSIGGITAGFERVFDKSASVGFAFGYSYTDFDADSVSSSGSVSSYTFGVYAEKQYSALDVLLGASYAMHNVETDRDIDFADFSDNADGDYDASTSQVFGEVSYAFKAGKGTVAPFFSSAYVMLDTDGFTEDGGEAALKVKSSDEDSLLTALGVRADGSYMLGTVQMKPFASIAWQHRYDDGADESKLAFADGSSFSAYGVSYTRDTAVLKLGVSNGLTENTELDFAYSGQFSEDVNDQSLRANLNIKF